MLTSQLQLIKHTDTPTVDREQKTFNLYNTYLYHQTNLEKDAWSSQGTSTFVSITFTTHKKYSQTHKELKELKTPKSSLPSFQLPLIKHTDTQRVERTQETQDKQERALCHRHNHNLQNTFRDTLLAWHKNNVFTL